MLIFAEIMCNSPNKDKIQRGGGNKETCCYCISILYLSMPDNEYEHQADDNDYIRDGEDFLLKDSENTTLPSVAPDGAIIYAPDKKTEPHPGRKNNGMVSALMQNSKSADESKEAAKVQKPKEETHARELLI